MVSLSVGLFTLLVPRHDFFLSCIQSQFTKFSKKKNKHTGLLVGQILLKLLFPLIPNTMTAATCYLPSGEGVYLGAQLGNPQLWGPDILAPLYTSGTLYTASKGTSTMEETNPWRICSHFTSSPNLLTEVTQILPNFECGMRWKQETRIALLCLLQGLKPPTYRQPKKLAWGML